MVSRIDECSGTEGMAKMVGKYDMLSWDKHGMNSTFRKEKGKEKRMGITDIRAWSWTIRDARLRLQVKPHYVAQDNCHK